MSYCGPSRVCNISVALIPFLSTPLRPLPAGRKLPRIRSNSPPSIQAPSDLLSDSELLARSAFKSRRAAGTPTSDQLPHPPRLAVPQARRIRRTHVSETGSMEPNRRTVMTCADGIVDREAEDDAGAGVEGDDSG